MAQTEEFILRNVAYRPNVYRTGIQTQMNLAILLFFGQQWFFDISIGKTNMKLQFLYEKVIKLSFLAITIG